MNFLFSSYSLVIISSTALLKVFLSIPQRLQCSKHLTLAERGALYKRANSPNPSPVLSSLLAYWYKNIITFSLTMTSRVPLYRIKKQVAWSYYLNIY